ncbi:MAG TPA: Ig-like domain-containing protein, partial [Fibrobacteria bacterium]|nr:Ig-like domain-containing protein [Fibrobacteria bacterium]
ATVVQPVTGITAGNITVVKDTDGSPLLTWTPSDATDKGYSLVSLNLAVASINGSKVRGVGGGQSIITVITDDGERVATFTVTVTVPVASIVVANAEMRIGDPDFFPTIQWVPSDATNRNVTLASSDPAVATIVNGKIRAVGRGRCIITITAEDGGKKTTFFLDVRNNNFLPQ